MDLTAVALTLLLTGSVVASDGSAVAGATVTAVLPAPIVVVTDQSGTFSFPDVELPLDLVVSAPGFATQHLRVTSSPVRITLLPRAVDVSVVVDGGSGRPGTLSISRDTLANTPAVTTDERLRTIAGLSLFRRSTSRTANPTTHGVTMRGLSASGASRGLVLLDGIPLNDGFGAWVTWTRVPSAALERVDVVTGAAGDLFGSDALGGVIRLQSAIPTQPLGTATVEGGSNATLVFDASAGGQLPRVSWFGAAGGYRSDGVVPLEAASAGAVDRPADAEWWNGFGRLDITVPRGRWSVYGFGGRDDRGNGTVLQRNRMAGGTFASSLAFASSATTIAARVSVSPNQFDQTFSAVAAGRATESLTSTQVIDSTTTRVAIEGGLSGARGYGLLQGTLSRASADFAETRTAGTTLLTLRDESESVSAQVAWTGWTKATVSAGVRHEWRAAPGADAARDTARVGRVGVTWSPAARVSLHGSAATSHRWPTLNELARGFRVGALLTNPNPDLAPERATTFEGGVRLSDGTWSVGSTLFHSVVHDAIVNVTQSAQVRQRRNAGDVVASGLEVDGEWRVTTFVRARGSLQYVDASFEDVVEVELEGKRPPQVPSISGTVSLDAAVGAARIGVLARSTGHQFDDDRNTLRLAAATQLDARVQVTLTPRVRGFVVVENVLDARVETGRTPLVTLAPGRAIRVGVSVSFGDLRR